MASVDQNGLHQRIGYSGDQSGWYVNNQQGFGGTPPQGQGNYAVQQGYGPNTFGPYQGPAQDLGPGEYVDRYGHVRRRVRGARLAACLALCWCVTWPCHGPCCGGL